MHKIFLQNRCMVICSREERILSDPNSVELHLGGRPDISSLVEMFENIEGLFRIYIPTDEVEKTYREFLRQFKEVNAAGGVVSNRRGDVLMISRSGKWDLPKGHQELREDIRLTAMREVQEETGVRELELGDLVCVTDHCYFRNGMWHLKHTWWYGMLYTGPVDLCPQTEEDISKAAWIAKSALPACLKNTYPSIAEVFREVKQCCNRAAPLCPNL